MTEILNWVVQNGGMVILIALVLIVMHKTGTLEPLLSFFSRKNGGSRVDNLEKHANIANHEMGEIRNWLKSLDKKVNNIVEDVAYIKGKINGSYNSKR